MTLSGSQLAIVSDAAGLRCPRRGAHRMGMAAPIYYTADMVRALPEDGNRYEVVYGELLVTPAPRPWHEIVQRRIWWRSRPTCGDTRSARFSVPAPTSPGARIRWSRPTSSWCRWSRPHARLVGMRDLLLVAEVLSPSSARHDRFIKRRRYQEAGIPLYWIVDADERQVEIWTPADTFPRFERERLVWQPAGRGGAVLTAAGGALSADLIGTGERPRRGC